MKTQKWIRFDEEHPRLRDRIEIFVSDDTIITCGQVTSLRDSGNRTLIDSENYVGMAVKGDDLWRLE